MTLLPRLTCACLLTACFEPSPPTPADTTGSTTDDPTTTPDPSTSVGPISDPTTTSDPPTTDTPTTDTPTTDTDASESTTEDSSTGSSSTGETFECDPGTFGPDCSGVCNCNGSECNDGVDGDGSCTCLPGTFGVACAGVCDCGATECDDGATGTGLCLCPDPATNTFTVAYLPAWGSVTDPALAYVDLESSWSSYGSCRPIFVPMPAAFTVNDLTSSGAHVLLASNPSGMSIQYSAAQILAIRDYVMDGGFGFVSTYLLRYPAADNSPLADLTGVDPLSFTLENSVSCDSAVDVLDAAHPMMANLPASFELVPSFSQAQGINQAWASALIDPAQIVASSADGLNVVVAYEDAWRGTKISTFPEYLSTTDGRQLLYNALLWSAYPASQ